MMIYFLAIIILSTANLAIAEVNGTNMNSKLMQNVCFKINITNPINCCRVGKAISFFGYLALALILTFIVIPGLCYISGFEKGGIREDSRAARYQSVHGTPKPFSWLQSFTARGKFVCIIIPIGMVLAAIKIFYFEKSCN